MGFEIFLWCWPNSWRWWGLSLFESHETVKNPLQSPDTCVWQLWLVYLGFFFIFKMQEKIPHTGNTRPFRTCVIKEYRYFTISLRKYHGWCQYHKSMSIGSNKRSKKGQERSRTVNTVKNGQYGPKQTKTGPKRSKTVKTDMVLGRSTMV